MVPESPSDSTRPPAEGRRLGREPIASLSGVGLLLIFMIQNTQRVRLAFLFWNFALAALAPHGGLRATRGVGVVRTGRDAPSPAPQGAPPRPTVLTRNQLSSPSRTAITLQGVSSQQPRGLGHAARDGPRRCGYRLADPWNKDGAGGPGDRRPTKKSAYLTPPNFAPDGPA